MVPTGNSLSSNAVANQIGAYVQDEWSPVQNLKLTMGLRADYLSFVDDIMTNNAILNLDFGGRNINTGDWPKAKVKPVTPRWLYWDVNGNKSLVVRGGTECSPVVCLWYSSPTCLRMLSMNQLLMKGTNPFQLQRYCKYT